jgi:hypothetical protein
MDRIHQTAGASNAIPHTLDPAVNHYHRPLDVDLAFTLAKGMYEDALARYRAGEVGDGYLIIAGHALARASQNLRHQRRQRGRVS